MSLHRKDAKRDANETEIVLVLEARGFHVDRISAKGFPDLVVSWRGRAWFVEIKRATGKLGPLYTPAQVQWRANWQGPTPWTLRTVEEALLFQKETLR